MNYSINTGTAQFATDYGLDNGTFSSSSSTGSITFLAGQQTVGIGVLPVDDTLDEGVEYFDVHVINTAAGNYIADVDRVRTVAIFDNDIPAPTPKLINVGLVNDTGISNTDRISHDQRIAATLQGTLSAGYVNAEFDHNGDFLPERILTLTQSPQSIVYDPVAYDSALAQHVGSVSIRYRTKQFSSAGTLLDTSEWKAFTYSVEADSAVGPMRIDPINLKKDTDTPGDLITANPIIVGRLLGDFLGGTARVEFDHDDDGIANGNVIVATSGSRFEYDPRKTDPSLENYLGTVTLKYRIVNLGSGVAGTWETFAFTLTAPPMSGYIVNEMSDHIGRGGDDDGYGLAISGRVIVVSSSYGNSGGDGAGGYGNGGSGGGFSFGNGSEEPGSGGGLENGSGGNTNGNGGSSDFFPPLPQAVRMQIDHNNDNVIDGETTSGNNLLFQYRPSNLQTDTHTFRARALEWNTDYGMYLFGSWTSYTFNYAAEAAPAIESLGLREDTGESSTDLITADPTLIGKLVGPIKTPAWVSVQFDLNQDSQADGDAQISDDGTFTITPTSLTQGYHTIGVRSKAYDGVVDEDAFGNWQTFSFNYEPLDLPQTTLGLLVDTGVSATDKITSVSALTGVISPLEGQNIEVQFDLNGDQVVDGLATPQSDGQFIFRPAGISFGSIDVSARVQRRNPYVDTIDVGPWTAFSFTLEAPNSTPLSLANLRLAVDTGVNKTDRVTTNPTLTAEITNLGDMIAETIEVDLNHDGIVDATSAIRANGNFRFTPVGLAIGEKGKARKGKKRTGTVIARREGFGKLWSLNRFFTQGLCNDYLSF